jgi:hypothetical protein
MLKRNAIVSKTTEGHLRKGMLAQSNEISTLAMRSHIFEDKFVASEAPSNTSLGDARISCPSVDKRVVPVSSAMCAGWQHDECHSHFATRRLCDKTQPPGLGKVAESKPLAMKT